MRAPLSALLLGASALSLGAACTPSAATPLTALAGKATPASHETSAGHARARAKAEILARLAPPVYAGTGEKADALAWTKGPFFRWYQESIAIYSDADHLFEEAARAAESERARLEITYEAFTMGARFFDRFVGAAKSATPREWADGEAGKSFMSAVTAPAKRLFWPLVKICVMRAEALHDDSATARDCNARLMALGTAPDDASAAETLAAVPSRQEPSWGATELIAPCTFRGSYHGAGLGLYTSPMATAAVAHIQSWMRIETDRVELAAPRSRRMRIEISAPVHMIAWVDATTPMFALPAKLAIVEGHAWFAEGASASAQATGAGGVVLTATLAGAEERLDFPVRERHVETSCAAMTLTAGVSPPRDPGASLVRGTADSWISLHELPMEGKALGRIHGPSFVHVLKQENGYARITATERGVLFDAWVRDDAFDSEENGMIGLLNTGVPDGWQWVDAKGQEALDVRVRGEASSPVVFRIPAGTPVMVKSGSGPFAEAKLTGVDSAKGVTFFVAREKLAATKGAAK